MNRVNIHSLREHLAFEMVEEDRLKKGLITEETTVKTPRKRLNKTTVLSQHRPDVRDVVKLFSISFFSLSLKHKKFRLNKLEKLINIILEVQITNQNKFFMK